MPENPFIAEFTSDWSPARRARLNAMLDERQVEMAAGDAWPLPAHAYPVPREEIDRLAPLGLKLYEELAKKLNLSAEKKAALLGLPLSAVTLKIDALGEEQFYRLSYLVGIYLDVGGLLGKDEAIRWFRTDHNNDEMAGRSPVSYLIEMGLPGFHYLRREVAYWAHNGW